MDGTQFDSLARGLAASHSRRRVLRLFAGATIGALLGSSAPSSTSAASCRALQLICRKDGDCCSTYCGQPDRTGRRRCACPPGLVVCDGGCVDTAADSGNCGGCGNACAPGDVCEWGNCVPPCVPRTCDSEGFECGSIHDGCSQMISCGTCAEGEDCRRGTCIPACTPRSCAGYCGIIDDECGRKIDCGGCPIGQICTHENRCCTPTSCQAEGVECGEIFDRCRHIEIFCGTCAPWATCEGGKCVECHSATDCPLHGMDPHCVTVVCNSGSCDYIYAPSGTPVPDQDAGDCRKNVCDGHGNVVTVPDDTDLPFVHGNECMLGSCLNGTPVNSPVDAGVPCSESGGGVCNGGGACVQCLTASDCPGQDSDCATRTCTAYICGFSFAFGTSCGPDGSGICDGSGNCDS